MLYLMYLHIKYLIKQLFNYLYSVIFYCNAPIMAEQTITTRLRDAFTKRRLTLRQVSADTGIGYSALQQIASGKVQAMGVDKFAAIWRAYPDLDGRYILTGEIGANPCAEVERVLNQVRAIVAP